LGFDVADWALHELCCRRFLMRLETAQNFWKAGQFEEAENEFELIFSGFSHRLGKFKKQLINLEKSEQLTALSSQIAQLIETVDNSVHHLHSLHWKQKNEQFIHQFFEFQNNLCRNLQTHLADIEAASAKGIISTTGLSSAIYTASGSSKRMC